DDCVIGRGRFYQGTVNVTKYGLPCQYWDSQEPHSHYRPPDVFPEMKNAENYCRNAGGEEPSPWCYTLDPAVRWQRCDIPICGDPPPVCELYDATTSVNHILEECRKYAHIHLALNFKDELGLLLHDSAN
ncbi:unnamed protein product, partial [Timema podura]|nr:unnamed protein product [Timema podura]